MRYVSTRGGAAPAPFLEVALAGPAPDGGLWMPERWPQLDLSAIGPTYADLATAVLTAFAGEGLDPEEAAELCASAYNGAAFAHQAVAPLRHLEPRTWLLELFHGPTLAFKDFALRLIAALWERRLKQLGERRCAVVATSGDTGGAAVAAFAGSAQVDLVAIHPRGRITDVQRRFMTTSGAANIHAVEVDGDFDAAQAMVKALFADVAFSEAVGLAAVNSINWARIAAQAAYYLAACRELGQPTLFVTPTGNFGDAFAGLVARKLGGAVAGVRAAVNANDMLARGLATGRFAAGPSTATLSPAMDIQAPSNLERLVFEATGRDGARTAAFQQALASGGATLSETERAAVAALGLSCGRVGVGDDVTAGMMHLALRRWGELICPHTAVGVDALTDPAVEGFKGPVVVLATAHPAKFPEAVEAATDQTPALPARVGEVMTLPERFTPLPCEPEALKAFIRAAIGGGP